MYPGSYTGGLRYSTQSRSYHQRQDSNTNSGEQFEPLALWPQCKVPAMNVRVSMSPFCSTMATEQYMFYVVLRGAIPCKQITVHQVPGNTQNRTLWHEFPSRCSPKQERHTQRNWWLGKDISRQFHRRISRRLQYHPRCREKWLGKSSEGVYYHTWYVLCTRYIIYYCGINSSTRR